MSTESRIELVLWINELLQLNYTNVRQAGTGVAYCQIMDSIYGDVPLTKVKFQCRHEYEFIHNFKVLQRSFVKHKIDKIIPVERLVKCGFQENLAFLQWIKGYWDQMYPGGRYDGAARRQQSIDKTSPPMSTVGHRRRRHSNGSISTASLSSGITSPSLNPHTSPSLRDLHRQRQHLLLAMDGFEKERDFYFSKLEAIEAFLQDQGQKLQPPTLFKLQTILTSPSNGQRLEDDDTF
ncbi:hypothetical protein DM01DRAFT_1365295 [Hesseltinella vesiculosa]|uniref:Microtubule binding protein n=1 Tax=Hesseltinella vesiculosa TaxID=101127 RepID=A0A1X2GYI8_9FUNG|nr:hypothetical protein DM01DRAFT_1365295 [Hesseltinella vesiculosa]